MSNNDIFYDFDLAVSPEGMSFFLENMSADATPSQYMRELTQNAIEAVSRTSGKGKIFWTVDQDIHKKSRGSQSKLSLIDNGDGMTGDEMVKYLNRLAASSSEKSQTGNFGVGAKITAGVLSPHGLVFVSWKDGIGAKVHFWKNPETGRYGLKMLTRKDGTMGQWTDIIDCTKPTDIIGQHGTKVTLLGTSDEDNTTKPPSNLDFGEKDWVSRYLSSHYTEFPQNIELRVSNTPSNKFSDGERVYGRSEYFGQHAVNRGTVDLPGVKAHWWLLGDVRQNTPVENKGHVGIVFQGELYETRMRRSGNSLLTQAGVIAGPDRVVLYFEPIAGQGQLIKPNTARGNILINSETAPISDWAATFAEQMPKPLKAYMEKLLSEAPEDVARRLRQRLEDVSTLFRSSAFQRADNGNTSIEPLEEGGLQEVKIKAGLNGSGGGEPGSGPEKTDNIIEGLGKFLQEKNDKKSADEKQGKKTKALVLPTTRWLDGENDQELEDRAAKYDPKSNQILINREFRGYTDLLKHMQGEYPNNTRTRVALTNTLDEFYSQVLVQAVLGVKGLSEKGAHLKSEYNALLLSPEALTTAVMVRAEIHDNVVKALRKDGIKPLAAQHNKKAGKHLDL